jgi:hypothetical protein
MITSGATTPSNAPMAQRGIPSAKPVVVQPPEEKKPLTIATEIQQEVFNIEESLENLELFKATNLGRLLQNNEVEKGSENNKSTQAVGKIVPQARYGLSPGQKGDSASKHKGAHVLVKNPFPDRLPFTQSKNSITSTSVNKKAINFDENDDILD